MHKTQGFKLNFQKLKKRGFSRIVARFLNKIGRKIVRFEFFWAFLAHPRFWAENEGAKVKGYSAYIRITAAYVFTAEIAESAGRKKREELKRN